MTTRKHSKYAASASDRWLACPGSVELCETVPSLPETDYSKEGTEAHGVLELIINGRNNGPVVPFHEVIKSLRKQHKKEMVDHALNALVILEEEAQGEKILSETKVFLKFIDPTMFGTVDAIIARPFDTLIIADYKYGAGIAVSAVANMQLAYYALAVAHMYDYNFKDVKMIIYQPRAYHEEGPLRSWTLSMSELRTYSELFAKGVLAAKDPLAPFHAGEHCRWCPGKFKCPEISSKALEAAKIDFADVAKVGIPTNIESDLGPYLDAFEKIETWIDAIKEQAFHTLNKGGKVSGYKLVPKRSTRQWTDLHETTKAAKRKFRETGFSKPELLSPAQFEKATGDKEWVASRVSDISSGLKLVKDTDGTPGLSQIAKDFKEIVLPEVNQQPKTSRRRK